MFAFVDDRYYFILFSYVCSRTKKNADRDEPTLFEIILDPSRLLEESTEEPTLFDIVLR